MSKTPLILFKAPALKVLKTTEVVRGRTTSAHAVLQTKDVAIMLDAVATEVLVSYLRVIRAYCTAWGKTDPRAPLLYQRVSELLTEMLRISGRNLATQQEITLLIQHLGCAHDWTLGLGEAHQ